MLDMRQVRSFVVLAAELSFSRAARCLNLTQPPLSRQIKLLEQELKVTLVERTSRRVTLTAAGASFLVEAKKLLAQSDIAVTASRLAARGSAGSIKVGFVGAATYNFLPLFVGRMRLMAPHIDLELVQMETSDQVQSIQAGTIDLGFSRPLFSAHRLDSICVFREPMILAIPRSHPIAAKRRPGLELLNGEPFITFSSPARYLHDKLDKLIAENGITPRIVQSLTHSQAILSLVSAGIGLAIVPAGTQNACFDNVVFRPLDLRNDCIADLHAVWSSENTNPLLLEACKVASTLAVQENVA